MTGYGFGEEWNLSLDLAGSSLTARLTDDMGSVVATLTDTDTSVAGPGTFGVRPANAGVTYANFTVEGTAVPEPASLGLAAGGVLLMLRRRG